MFRSSYQDGSGVCVCVCGSAYVGAGVCEVCMWVFVCGWVGECVGVGMCVGVAVWGCV